MCILSIAVNPSCQTIDHGSPSVAEVADPGPGLVSAIRMFVSCLSALAVHCALCTVLADIIYLVDRFRHQMERGAAIH